jgi:acyl-[acyl-carrier-protein]-phospholipid O-acyltransferase / long-chain-fatty-acid--[acyl-carrier-protein] ligase
LNTNKSIRALAVVQFFDAFNDNAFKIIVSLLAIRTLSSLRHSTEFVSLIGLIFTVPFIIFSPLAGYLVDKYSRRRVIIGAKIIEILAMLIGIGALAGNSWPYMCVVVFIIASQSVIFSTAKYALLADMLKDNEISQGNGLLQMSMFLGVLAGTAFGGYALSFFTTRFWEIGFLLTSFALIGLLMALRLPSFEKEVPPEALNIKSTRDVRRVLADISRAKPLFQTLLGLAFFWFAAAIFQINILLYGVSVSYLHNVHISVMLVWVAIGIACGGLLAGKLSEGKVELGLVPLSAAGISVFCLLLGFIPSTYSLTLILLFFLGLSAGCFTVPLNAFFQTRSPVNRRGQFLAVLNVVTALAVLCGSVLLWVSSAVFSMGPERIFLLMGALAAVVTIYILWKFPEALARMCVWIFVHTYYRLKIVNQENIPDRGAALLVCNHVSFLDGMVISASLKRPVRFLMDRKIYNLPGINFFCRILRVIPISADDPPKVLVKALQEAREELRSGGIVCVFPEGGLTRTGNMLSFRRGYTHIIKGLRVPIIPMNIDKMWGDIFSWSGGKWIWKIARQIPYPVTVSAGKPLTADAKTHEIRLAVQELWAEAFKLRGLDRKKLHISFIEEAKKHPFKFFLADSTGIELTYIKALAAMIIMKGHLFPGDRLPRETNEMVGILLPASGMGVIANGAVLLAGKVPVNLNFTLSQESLESTISQCGMKMIVTSRKFLEKLGRETRPEMIFLEDLKDKTSGFIKFKTFIAALVLPPPLIRFFYVRGDKTNVDDLATVMFSSGSTGEPKGIMLTHANIASNIEAFYQVFNIKNDDVVMGALPFFHSFGFTATMCFPAGVGIGVVYHSNPLDAATIGKLVEKYKATLIMGTPTFLSAYLRKCSAAQFKTIRVAIAGAEKLKPQLADTFYEKFRVFPFEGYGATELSPIVSAGFPDYVDNKKMVTQIGYKSGKVGQPIPGVAVKTVDPETFELKGVDQEGLLLVKGANVMKGYLNKPGKTAEVIKDGWYITGDIATIDEDGFIHITDRLSRFSKIGGEMVPHIKIEENIMEIIGSTEPVCAVTAVNDEKKGERLVVLHSVDMDLDEICEALSKRGLPNLWIPRKDNFYKIDTIPFLGSGKIDLKKVKEIAQQYAAASSQEE